MRLRKECEHGRWEAHSVVCDDPECIYHKDCPGGEFLPEGALVIEKVDGEWPKLVKAIIHEWWTQTLKDPDEHPATALLDALALLPEKCGTCGGSGVAPDNNTAAMGSGVFVYRHCPTCHGSGKANALGETE